MKKIFLILSVATVLWSCNDDDNNNSNNSNNNLQSVEVVAELEVSPGNVAVSREGRVFMTIHPLRATDTQLVEVINNDISAFPDRSFQSTTDTRALEKFDAPLGVFFDNQNRLWVVDAGLGLSITKVFAFDINTREQLFRFDVPATVAPPGSFAQDLAVDEVNNWVYLADFANQSIIAIDIDNNEFRQFSDPTMRSEDIDIVIDNEVVNFQGAPARIGINPITLSGDRETLYYGSINGNTWYSIPTALFRNNQGDSVISEAITEVGQKPISDGADTDQFGNHYFTNLQEGGIDVLDNSGTLRSLVRDESIVWPDNIRVSQDGFFYIAVNQLNRAPAFTGRGEESVPPFLILRGRALDR